MNTRYGYRAGLLAAVVFGFTVFTAPALAAGMTVIPDTTLVQAYNGNALLAGVAARSTLFKVQIIPSTLTAWQ